MIAHSHRQRVRRLPRSAAAVAATMTTLVLGTGCGSSGGSKASSAPAGPGVAQAQAKVAQLSQPTLTFPAPGPPLKNVKSLAGKTVWYIPITQQVSFFQDVSRALQTGLGKAGVSLRTCSGEANPSATAACVNQAVAAGAGAIIVDAIPIVVAAHAFAAAQAQNIPVLVTDQLPPPPGLPGVVQGIGNHKLAYQELGATALETGVADWIIADSKGHANVLIEELTDSPSTMQYIQQGAVAEFNKYCPQCHLTIAKVNIANLSLIPSQTSSALLSHPDINYVMPEFDALLQGVQAGVQQSGFAHKVKGATASGLLFALQLIKSHNFLAADVGIDYPYQGWAIADEIMRMMLKQAPVNERTPHRLFTAGNIGSLTLTPAGEASGAWYGSSAYTTMFTRLWGV
jgi:ribose transport system substrate-binding protein